MDSSERTGRVSALDCPYVSCVVDRKPPSGQNIETQWFLRLKGVRQGDILSPHLFNLYADHTL